MEEGKETEQMEGWRERRMEQRKGGWVDGVLDRRRDGRKPGWVAGWVDGWVGGWVAGWMDELTHGETGRWVGGGWNKRTDR